MKRLPTITACLLAAHNEAPLLRSIRSVSGHVDEIVVVALDSAGDTAAVARQCGAKVHCFEWAGSYGAARNAALQQASSDWVLFIEADEEFVWHKTSFSLRETIALQAAHSDRFWLRRIHGENSGQSKFVRHAARIFKRECYRYEGAVEERLVRCAGETRRAARWLKDGTLLHSKAALPIRTQAARQRIGLLRQELEAYPRDGRLAAALAEQYDIVGEPMLASFYAAWALHKMPVKHTYERAQAYYYLMMSLLEQREDKQAMTAAELAAAEIPGYADAYAVQFELYCERRDFARALHAYRCWAARNDRERLLPNHLGWLAGRFRMQKEAAEAAFRALRQKPALPADGRETPPPPRPASAAEATILSRLVRG